MSDFTKYLLRTLDTTRTLTLSDRRTVALIRKLRPDAELEQLDLDLFRFTL